MMDVHIKDNLNYLNDLRVKYAQTTSSVGPTSGTTTLDVLSAPAFTPISSSRLLLINAHVRGVTQSVATDVFEFRIQEGSTVLNAVSIRTDSATFSLNGLDFSTYVASATAAAHTYKLTIVRTNGTGTGTVDAAATYPIQIIVADIAAA